MKEQLKIGDCVIIKGPPPIWVNNAKLIFFPPKGSKDIIRGFLVIREKTSLLHPLLENWWCGIYISSIDNTSMEYPFVEYCFEKIE